MLVQSILRAVAQKAEEFQSSGRPPVSVDTNVGNAGRLTKFYGTVARKGNDTEVLSVAFSSDDLHRESGGDRQRNRKR